MHNYSIEMVLHLNQRHTAPAGLTNLADLYLTTWLPFFSPDRLDIEIGLYPSGERFPSHRLEWGHLRRIRYRFIFP